MNTTVWREGFSSDQLQRFRYISLVATSGVHDNYLTVRFDDIERKKLIFTSHMKVYKLLFSKRNYKLDFI